MKYLFLLTITMASLTGCKKNDCVQCTQQVKNTIQPTPITTDYRLVYVEFCGRAADTAMTGNQGAYDAFVQEHNIVPNTCFYNQ